MAKHRKVSKSIKDLYDPSHLMGPVKGKPAPIFCLPYSSGLTIPGVLTWQSVDLAAAGLDNEL